MIFVLFLLLLLYVYFYVLFFILIPQVFYMDDGDTLFIIQILAEHE